MGEDGQKVLKLLIGHVQVGGNLVVVLAERFQTLQLDYVLA